MKISLTHGNAYCSKLKNGGWYLDSIIVEEAFRNKGIGSKLMRKIITKCHPPIYLLASTELGGSYDKLVGFYHSFGFELVRSEKKYGRIEYNYNMVYYPANNHLE